MKWLLPVQLGVGLKVHIWEILGEGTCLRINSFQQSQLHLLLHSGFIRLEPGWDCLIIKVARRAAHICWGPTVLKHYSHAFTSSCANTTSWVFSILILQVKILRPGVQYAIHGPKVSFNGKLKSRLSVGQPYHTNAMKVFLYISAFSILL